jgi:transposase-like protein
MTQLAITVASVSQGIGLRVGRSWLLTAFRFTVLDRSVDLLVHRLNGGAALSRSLMLVPDNGRLVVVAPSLGPARYRLGWDGSDIRWTSANAGKGNGEMATTGTSHGLGFGNGSLIEYPDGTVEYRPFAKVLPAFKVRICEVVGFSVRRVTREDKKRLGASSLEQVLVLQGSGTTIAEVAIGYGTAQKIEDWFRAHPEFGSALPPQVAPRARPISLEDAKADARRVIELLGGQVFNLAGTDETSKQALADASERFTAASSQIHQATTAEQAMLARKSAVEGLYYVRAARLAMGLDPGPDLEPMVGHQLAREAENRRGRIEGNHIQAPPTSPSTPNGLVADELVKLAQLRDAGVLTPEEFQAQKARLLG